jgi:hypothetical protein
MSLQTLTDYLRTNTRVWGMRAFGIAATSDDVTPMSEGANGGLLVDLADLAGGATAALQLAANVLLGYIAPGNTTALVSTAGATPTVDFDPGVPFTLIVMTAGIVVVRDNNGHQITLTTTTDGYVHPGLLRKVYVHVSNTATGLVAVY